MIRAKLVLRNVISKPLRSAIIILSLAAAAFAALFCISGIHTAQNSLRDFFTANYGDVNIICVSSSPTGIKVNEKDFNTESTLLRRAGGTVSLTVPSSHYLNYVNSISITVVGIDTELAHKLRMTDKVYPTEDGITITEPLAAQIGKKIGDTFTFYGDEEKEYTMKILDIVPANRFLANTPVAMIVSQNVCNEISGNPEDDFQILYIKIPEETVSDTIGQLMEKYPDHGFMGTTSIDSDETLDSMLNIYYLIFAVVFLMVCFIVVSMSRHIINERMSVIGMLRSIGGSITGTGMLLLSESAFYGLCGGLLGTLIFLPLRNSALLSWFVPASDEGIAKSDGINLLTICLVIVAVILIQCVFSAAAIMKASRTPVRDIIFGTKETVYLPSKILTVFGGILLSLGIVIYTLPEDFMLIILSAFCSVIGAVLFFPWLLSMITKGLSALFEKINKPVAKLAAKECSSVKSSVSSAQLILSAVSLTIAMLVIASSLLTFLAAPIYDADIMITSPEQKGEQYQYVAECIDGVTGVETLYYQSLTYESQGEVNGEKRDLQVMGLNEGGFRFFQGIRDCPEALAENEVSVDKTLASRLSLHVGDEITVRLKIESYLPKELKLKIKSFIDASYFNSMGNTILINLNVFKTVYYDTPTLVLIRTEPGKAYSVLDTMRSTLPDSSINMETVDEFMENQKSSMSSILTIVYAVIILGLALSLLGTSSNILMGFEQSRRKYAVYYSSSMSKEMLKKLIVSETMLTSGISAVCAVVFGLYFLQIITKALGLLKMSFPLVQPVLSAVIAGAAAFILLLIVVIKPVRMLSRMNIAEEIKTNAD